MRGRRRRRDAVAGRFGGQMRRGHAMDHDFASPDEGTPRRRWWRGSVSPGRCGLRCKLDTLLQP